jgi:RimJ/RimL family protein N-acetyltransferase
MGAVTAVPTLETERLTLRPFRDADLDAYAAIVGDAEVMRYIGSGEPATREEAWRHMAMILGHWLLRGYGLWAVAERATDEVVGRIGFFNPEGWPGFELGWTLSRRVWGRGYATEGARAALAWAAAALGRDSAISLIHPENAASIRVAERLGARLEERIEFRGSEALVYRTTRGGGA